MAKIRDDGIYKPRTLYTDRAKQENNSFSDLTVVINKLDTALLLLASEEEPVLITVFNHITEFIRKQQENVIELKGKQMMSLLLQKNLYMSVDNILVRRFALYVLAALFENSEIQEYDTERTSLIMEQTIQFFNGENDDFCIEYLCYIINYCLRDPQVAHGIIEDNNDFLVKFQKICETSENPDIVLNTVEAIQKMLQVQKLEDVMVFSTRPEFPIDRMLCELTNEFREIRSAALKVVKSLIVNTSENSAFAPIKRCIFALQQLIKVFCDNAMSDDAPEIIDVISIALRTEKMTKIFFEQNLFDRLVENMEENVNKYPIDTKCSIIQIFAEAANYSQFYMRLHNAGITQLFIICLLQNEPAPATHVLLGLNRMVNYPEASRKIVECYAEGLLSKLLRILPNVDVNIKTREQTAELIGRLLLCAFHDTASGIMELALPEVLAEVFDQGLPDLSIDLILSILGIIESLAQNDQYREGVGACKAMTKNLSSLLMHSYAHSILVNNIFRCLCTLIDEEPVREILLENYIVSSIKRGLKSLSNLVKTAVTNFILQTTRFNEYSDAYVSRGILEVLMDYQKHAFCVSTWGPAIESVLAKSPTLKFCIRNHLGFTDSTAGRDFYVAKKRFEDFRIFQTILNYEVSPLDPILVINFERPTAEDLIVVPTECFQPDELKGDDNWCFCKRPGDEFLPQFLEELNQTLASYGLVENPEKVQRCIDFDNLAKRAKIVAESVAYIMNLDLKVLDLNSSEECSRHIVKCHLKDLRYGLHTNFIPLGMVRSGCQFERAVLFKCFADQIGLPATLQRSVDGKILFNEVPLPLDMDVDIHCDKMTMRYMPWRMLRPTHIVDLMYNVGELYPLQSRQALQYLRLY